MRSLVVVAVGYLATVLVVVHGLASCQPPPQIEWRGIPRSRATCDVDLGNPWSRPNVATCVAEGRRYSCVREGRVVQCALDSSRAESP